MAIHEYYCPDNHTVYRFCAQTPAQANSVPVCPHNSAFRMEPVLPDFFKTEHRVKARVSANLKDERGGERPCSMQDPFEEVSCAPTDAQAAQETRPRLHARWPQPPRLDPQIYNYS